MKVAVRWVSGENSPICSWPAIHCVPTCPFLSECPGQHQEGKEGASSLEASLMGKPALLKQAPP